MYLLCVYNKNTSYNCRNTSNDGFPPGLQFTNLPKDKGWQPHPLHEFLLQVKVFPLIGQNNTYIRMACQNATKRT